MGPGVMCYWRVGWRAPIQEGGSNVFCRSPENILNYLYFKVIFAEETHGCDKGPANVVRNKHVIITYLLRKLLLGVSQSTTHKQRKHISCGVTIWVVPSSQYSK